ncbi:MAG: hypothetical protein U0Q12_10340 [Vicinamibacterales bacterium]
MGLTTAMTADDVSRAVHLDERFSRQKQGRRDWRCRRRGATISKRLEGRCVHTIVFSNPMRRASQAAPTCDTAFNTRAAKNRIARSASDAMPY